MTISDGSAGGKRLDEPVRVERESRARAEEGSSAVSSLPTLSGASAVLKAITATPWNHQSNASTVLKAITAGPLDFELVIAPTLNLNWPNYESAISAALKTKTTEPRNHESVIATALKLTRSNYDSVISAALKARTTGPRNHERATNAVLKAITATPWNHQSNASTVLKAITAGPLDFELVIAPTLNQNWPNYESAISAALKAKAATSHRAAASRRHALDVNCPFEEIDADLEDAPQDAPPILQDHGLAAVWRDAAAALWDWLGRPKVKALGSLSAVMMLSAWWVDLRAYHPDVADMIEVPLATLLALLIQLVFMTWPREPK